ncbi:MAG: hypothetical protein JWM10_3320 [Myxococcaceae bacterium]|nr:hypothetical protein [Myxococcaceae bacterium]
MTAADVALPPGWSLAPDGRALVGPGGRRTRLLPTRPEAAAWVSEYLTSLAESPGEFDRPELARRWPTPAGALLAMADDVAASVDATAMLLVLALGASRHGLAWADVAPS